MLDNNDNSLEIGQKKKPKWLMVCALLIVVGVVCFGIYYYKNNDNNSSNLEDSKITDKNSSNENEVEEVKDNDNINEEDINTTNSKDNEEQKQKDNTNVIDASKLKKINYYISDRDNELNHYVYYDGSTYNELFSLNFFDYYIGTYKNQIVYQGFDKDVYIGMYDPNTLEKKELFKLPKGNCTGTGCVEFQFDKAWIVGDKIYFTTSYDLNMDNSNGKYKTSGLNYISLSANSFDEYVNIELTGVKNYIDHIIYLESEKSFYYSVVTYVRENNNYNKSYVTIYSYNVTTKETKEVYKYDGTRGSFILKSGLIAYFTSDKSYNISNIYNMKTKKNIVLNDKIYLLGDFEENVVFYDNHFYYKDADKKIYKYSVSSLNSTEVYTITGLNRYFRRIKVYNNNELEIIYDKYRYNEVDLDILTNEYVLNGKKVESLPKPKLKNIDGNIVEFEYKNLNEIIK